MNNRIQPSHIEAEQAILGGLLFDPRAILKVEAELKPEAFYFKPHQEIYRAILSLHRKQKLADLMAVSTYLNDRDLLDEVGGMKKLSRLLHQTISASNIERYINLVNDKYIRRRLISSGHEIVLLAHDNAYELEDILNDSQSKIFQVCEQQSNGNTESTAEISTDCFLELESDNPIFKTGLRDLDNLISGFEPKTFSVLGGRPSMGKTAIALFLMLQMSIVHQLPVICFSLEMSKQQIQYRLWSLISKLSFYDDLNLTKISIDRLRKYRSNQIDLNQQELDSIAKIIEISAELPIFINSNRGINVAGIAAECRKIKAREGKLGLVVVDYLQMMASENISSNRSYDLGDVARGLYKLADEIDAPILALSQVSRGVESRNDKRPMMSDLSQSGMLEMVADNVIFAYRDEYYNKNTRTPHTLELILSKARHGRTDKVTVLFDKSSGLIDNL